MADYSNSKFEIIILAERIFKLIPFEGAEIEVEDVREMRSVYLKFSGERSFAILLDATHNFTTSDEARVLLASKEFTEKRVAAAFVTTTLASKIVGNFFIKFNKPASPTKLFTEEAPAFEWLKEKMKENDKASK